MRSQDELERRVVEAFRTAAQEVDVDRLAARDRLAVEVGSARRRIRRARAAAVAAVIVLLVGGVSYGVVSAGKGRPSGLVPAQPGPSTPATGAGRPSYLDVDTRTERPLPSQVVPPLTGNSVSYSQSPDGRWLAWATRALQPWGGNASSGGLVRLDGSDRVALPVSPDEGLGGLVWSPDSSRVAYQVTNGQPRSVGRLEVYDLSTGATRVVATPEIGKADFWNLIYDFTADGRSLLYDLPRRQTGDTRWDVWSVPVTGGDPRRVLTDARAPAAFPDGSGIAYVEPTPGSWGGSAVRVHTRTGADREVVAGQVSVLWVHVSPDSTRIAYSDGGTRVVDVATGHVEKVTSDDLHGWADAGTLLVSGAG